LVERRKPREKINRVANELQRFAGKELAGTPVMIALMTALGNEVAAMVLRRNPSMSSDGKQHVLDQALDGACQFSTGLESISTRPSSR
jgi:hypothetical protein